MLILILCRSGGARRGNHAIEQASRRWRFYIYLPSRRWRFASTLSRERHNEKHSEKIHRRDAGARRATYKPWTSPAPDRTIDHAFCSPGAAFAGGGVFATDGYLSDHQPVVFEVSFNNS